ncbi:hypothetical protein BX616_002185, partial [Lobosporangium transversale]
LYGSEIVLINDLTGIATDRLIIRKVENGKVIRNGSGPVSQMQKIVLQHPDRVHLEDGRPYYLSASSIGSPKIEGKIPLQAAMDRSPLLEYRTSSKKASILDLTEISEENEDEYYTDESYHGRHGQASRRVSKGNENVSVDDFVCWTIAGIAKFDYTYFGPIPLSNDNEVNPHKIPQVLSHPRYNSQSNTLMMKVKNVFERLSAADEEARLRSTYIDDPYERKMSLSEFVYRRCEDVRQPMEDEEGPIQLWLAQHGPIRMRRRLLKDVLPSGSEETENGASQQDQNDNDEDDASDLEAEVEAKQQQQQQQQQMEDKLPKIPTKPNAAYSHQQLKHQQQLKQQQQMQTQQQQQQSAKRAKILRRPMGLEAELPYGCEVRAAIDSEGNAHAEMDLLMVERASGIAYPTGYKVVYSRSNESTEWTVEVVIA